MGSLTVFQPGNFRQTPQVILNEQNQFKFTHALSYCKSGTGVRHKYESIYHHGDRLSGQFLKT